MCLTITNPTTLEPQVATEDMVVYKIICYDIDFVGHGRYFTPYMITQLHFNNEGKAYLNTRYMQGKYIERAESELRVSYDVRWSVSDYTNKPITDKYVRTVTNKTIEEALSEALKGPERYITRINRTLAIDEGIHAYATREAAINRFEDTKGMYYRMMVAKCYIPKGSIYFLGDLGDIVANQMVITDQYEAEFKREQSNEVLPDPF